MLVFVYGTLKRGNCNERRLENGQFVGEAVSLRPAFRMFCNGHYPYVVKSSKDGYHVHGELYEIDENVLAGLDQLEGYPYGYDRDVVDFINEAGETVGAWLYTVKMDHIYDCEEILTGIWNSPDFSLT